jgi:hypothetical protein
MLGKYSTTELYLPQSRCSYVNIYLLFVLLSFCFVCGVEQ